MSTALSSLEVPLDSSNAIEYLTHFYQIDQAAVFSMDKGHQMMPMSGGCRECPTSCYLGPHLNFAR